MLACVRHSLVRLPLPAATRLLSTAQTTPTNPPPKIESVLGRLLSDMSQLEDSLPPSESSVQWKTFHPGEFIQPNDLTPSRCNNDRKGYARPIMGPPSSKARYNDIFHQLDLDPMDFALCPSVLRNYVSEMGKIYSRGATGLTARSQRRLAKAIRRARMIGVMPQLSRPPRQWGL